MLNETTLILTSALLTFITVIVPILRARRVAIDRDFENAYRQVKLRALRRNYSEFSRAPDKALREQVHVSAWYDAIGR